MFKVRRITILLFILILIIVATVTWSTKYRALKWTRTLDLVVYPINADQSEKTRAYMANLKPETFEPIATMMRDEVIRYGVASNQPVKGWLAPALDGMMPPPPSLDSGNVLLIMWRRLKQRYWAFRHDHFELTRPNIRLFALHHDPALTRVLAHSLGFEKGMLGVANVFASHRQTGSNNVVLAHEMLHTLGATDKYDLQTSLPIFPDDLAEPTKNPLYPQLFAELTGGRIPLTATTADIPDDLSFVRIGAAAARELKWLK